MGESIFAINCRWEFDAAVAQGFGWATKKAWQIIFLPRAQKNSLRHHLMLAHVHDGQNTRRLLMFKHI